MNPESEESHNASSSAAAAGSKRKRTKKKEFVAYEGQTRMKEDDFNVARMLSLHAAPSKFGGVVFEAANSPRSRAKAASPKSATHSKKRKPPSKKKIQEKVDIDLD